MSPVKTGKRNPSVKYYNLEFQSADEVFRGVSYREDLREKLQHAQKTKSPLKLMHVKRKVNYHDNTKTDIEVNNKTQLIEVPEIQFKYRKLEEDCPVLTIHGIQNERKNKDLASVEAFVNVDNRPVVTVNTKFGFQSINKKEVAINDETGIIKLALWGDDIQKIPKSAVYKLEYLRVQEYPVGVLNLSTTPRTNIQVSDKQITPSKVLLRELSSSSVKLPAEAVAAITKSYACPKCKQKSNNYSGKLYKCTHCKAVMLLSKLECNYMLKLTFKNCPSVLLYQQQLLQYFQSINKSFPDDEDDIIVEMLTNNTKSLIVDSKNVCIGVSKD